MSLGTRISLILISLLTCQTASVFGQDVHREHVNGNVWRIDGAVDVIGVQTGPDGLVMVDTGYPFAEQGVRSALHAIAGTDEPTLIINTHVHHGFSNHLYGQRSEIIAHQRVMDRMESGFLMAGTIVEPFDETARPDRTFSDSLTLNVNGEDVSLIHFEGAHTDTDAVVFFHESNVVMTGDLLVPHMPWISIDEGADFEHLMAGLDRLIHMMPDDALIIPGHDPVTLGKSDLYNFRDMLQSAADTVKSRMEAGMSLRKIKTLGLPDLSGWQGAVPEALFIESLYRSLVEARERTSAPTLAFENGFWWDGARFIPQTAYSVGGLLQMDKPQHVDRSIDLNHGFVIPPLGEAHTHSFGQAVDLEDTGDSFIDDGIYYAMVQDPSAEVTDQHKHFSNRVDTPDISFTQGVVTPSWGVITDFYEMMSEMGRFGDATTLAELDGSLLFRIDTVDDLEAAWPNLERINDRFIKVIVAFSDEIEERRSDPETFDANPPQYSAKPGVTPEVLTALVSRAHEAGLQVSAHIETAADFRLAVDAGVDWIAHMPASWQVGDRTGYALENLDPWLIEPEDAMAARRAGTKIVTTLVPWDDDDSRLATFREIHTRNLRILSNVGATLVIGSDYGAGSVVDEVLYLRSLGVLSDTQLFRLASIQTPRAIFPERKLGHLRSGWEASFIVLDDDPTKNLEALRDVRLRVKSGSVIE